MFEKELYIESKEIKNKKHYGNKVATFDKQAQDALPEEIKAKMKADREKAIMDRQLKETDALNKNKIEMTKEILTLENLIEITRKS